MSNFFGKLVGTAIEIVKLPVAVAKDVVTIGGIATDKDKSYTGENLDDIKDAAK